MSKFTLNTILDSIKSDVQDVLSRLSQDEINELTPSGVCDLLDENSYYAPEVVYNADAWEIVAGSSFSKYSADFLDFSIDNAMTQIGYNAIYGNTYLWCEDVPYTIFISDFDSTIKALYSCPYDGEEVERNCSNDENKMMKWAERLRAKSEKKEEV